MKTEFGVIRITTPPVAVNDYYENVMYFVAITTDENGSLKYTCTEDPRKATEIRNDTDKDNRKVQALIALIKTLLPKSFKIEHKIVKISIE